MHFSDNLLQHWWKAKNEWKSCGNDHIIVLSSYDNYGIVLSLYDNYGIQYSDIIITVHNISVSASTVFYQDNFWM